MLANLDAEKKAAENAPVPENLLSKVLGLFEANRGHAYFDA